MLLLLLLLLLLLVVILNYWLYVCARMNRAIGPTWSLLDLDSFSKALRSHKTDSEFQLFTLLSFHERARTHTLQRRYFPTSNACTSNSHEMIQFKRINAFVNKFEGNTT